ncbi:MAG: signal peptidase I [Micrococcales bacterium]|nr:signal peptidase I [Micrococcales bacterium]
MTAGTRFDDPVPAHPAGAGSRHSLLRALALVVGALLLITLVRAFLVQTFYVSSESMEPTLRPGQRILVDRTVSGGELRRGDVVVVDGTGTLTDAERPAYADGIVGRLVGGAAGVVGIDLGETDFVKRVAGLPGDRVRVQDGVLTINGQRVAEPYLAAGVGASDVPFDVTVPEGRLWLLGDNRAHSSDSRSRLGKPGGGMVPTDDVVGRAARVYWPLDAGGAIPGAPSLADIPRQKESP